MSKISELQKQLRIEKERQIAQNTLDNAVSWGGTIYDRDKPRVDALNRFIKKYT